MPQFINSVDVVMNDALKEGARDTLIKAKQRAPFDKGGLRADSDAGIKGKLHWRVSFWKEYARFQEKGGDSKRRVQNYSTPGTGKDFLKKSGDEEAKKINMVFKKHGKRARP